MKHLIAFYHSWLWALQMNRKVSQDLSIFGRIDPRTVKDIDKFLRQRGEIL